MTEDEALAKLESITKQKNSLEETYENLGDIIVNHPKLSDKAFELFKEVVQSEANDDSSLASAYNALRKIISRHPKLAETASDLFTIAFQSEKNGGAALYEAADLLSAISHESPDLVHMNPDLAKTVVETILSRTEGVGVSDYADRCLAKAVEVNKDLLQTILDKYASDGNNDDEQFLKSAGFVIYNLGADSDFIANINSDFEQASDSSSILSDKYNYYRRVGNVMNLHPRLARVLLDKFEDAVKSDVNDGDTLLEAYRCLSDIVEKYPELSGRCLEVVKTALQSGGNNSISFKYAYETLGNIVKKQPESADEAFELFKAVTRSDTGMFSALTSAYEVLNMIVENHPEFSEKALQIVEEAVHSTGNHSSSLKEVYRLLSNVIVNQPELTDKSIEIFKAALLSRKNDYHTLQCVCEYLKDAVIKHPELFDKVFDLFEIAMQSEKNSHYSLNASYGILTEIIKEHPQLIDKVFELFKGTWDGTCQARGNVTTRIGITYKHLIKIANEPGLSDKGFELFNTALQSPANDSYALREVSRLLKEYVIRDPESEDKIFELLKTAAQSEKNDEHSFNEIYNDLSDIIGMYPTMTEKAIEVFGAALQTDDTDARKKAYHNLWDIVSQYPETTDRVFELLQTAIESERDSKSEPEAYMTLDIVLKSKPELADKTFELLQTIMRSEQFALHPLPQVYEVLGEIVESKPELADKVFEQFQTIRFKSDEEAEGQAVYNALAKIVENKPDMAEKILDALEKNSGFVELEENQDNQDNDSDNNENYNNDDDYYDYDDDDYYYNDDDDYDDYDDYNNYNDDNHQDYGSTTSFRQVGILYSFNKLFAGIAKARPELAEKVLVTARNLYYSDAILTTLKECMKHLPLNETVAAYPQMEQDIRVAHKGRFADDTEFEYALANFGKEKIMDSNIFSAQQKMMNVLVSTSYLYEKCETETQNILYDINERQEARLCASSFYMDSQIAAEIEKMREKPVQWWSEGQGDEHIASSIRKWKKEARDFRRDDASEEVKEYVKNNCDWLIPISFRGAEIFKSYFPAYIKTIQNYNKKCVKDGLYAKKLSIHDALYWLPKPMSKEANARFSDFIRNNIIYQNAEHQMVHRPLNELKIIAQNWNALENKLQNIGENDDIAKLKYSDVLSVCMSVKYENQRSDAFAVEAAKHGVPEHKYHNCEDIYLAGLKVPEPFDSKKEFKEGKYVGRFLPRDDVRTGFFGDYTDCCQHFGGIGNSCAVSTVKHPFSQLFVIEDDKGKIIAGSWTWENTEGKYREVCFDNIETLGELSKRPEINRIYEQVGKYLTEEQNCRRVTIGLGYQDADVSDYQATKAIALPKLYGNDGTDSYSDASSQVLLCENPNAEPLDKTQESQRYIRDVCHLDVKAMESVSNAVFPDGDKELQAPDNMAGFVIEDREKGVVGYCLYDKEEKSIYDMAVLPEYRTDKNASSKKLFAEMMRTINQEGGKWSAEMRDSTTLKYLEIMAQRGLVKYEKHGVDHTMSDGSQVVAVTFEPVRDDVRQATNKLKGKLEENTAKTVDMKPNTNIHGAVIVKDPDAREA